MDELLAKKIPMTSCGWLLEDSEQRRPPERTASWSITWRKAAFHMLTWGLSVPKHVLKSIETTQPYKRLEEASGSGWESLPNGGKLGSVGGERTWKTCPMSKPLSEHQHSLEKKKRNSSLSRANSLLTKTGTSLQKPSIFSACVAKEREKINASVLLESETAA